MTVVSVLNAIKKALVLLEGLTKKETANVFITFKRSYEFKFEAEYYVSETRKVKVQYFKSNQYITFISSGG